MEDHLDMAPFVGGYSASSAGASHLGHYAPSSSSSSSYSSNGNNHNNNSLSQHHHHHQQQQQHSYHASSPSASSSYLPSSDFVADSLHILSSLSHQQEICNSSISLHNLHSLASSSCSTSSRPLPSSAAAASSSSSTSSSSSNVGSGSAASSPSSPLFNDPSSPPVQTTTPKKRGRKRKYGDTSDPEELKKQLRARDQEISRLKRRIQQLETLLQQQQSSSAASFANASSSSSDASSSSSSSASLSNHNNSGDVFGIYVNRNPDQVEKEVRNVLLSVKQQVTSQMVYRSSLKHAHSRISAQVPRVSAQAVDVIFQELNPKSKGPKLIKWACSATDLANIFGIYGKSLRYGASLEVVGQSNVTWQREDGDLSIKGKFTMVRG